MRYLLSYVLQSGRAGAEQLTIREEALIRDRAKDTRESLSEAAGKAGMKTKSGDRKESAVHNQVVCKMEQMAVEINR